MSSLRPGSVVSHYEIRRLIARGGMGEVYKAVDSQLGRGVALKILSPALATDRTARRRFLREARAASTLSHPGICTIFEVGQVDGRIFIAMQYVEGKTLQDVLSQGPLQIETALGYAIRIADALGEAHKNGVIHRDIKPSNIIINDRGEPVVLDFGLAKQFLRVGSGWEDSPTLLQATTEPMTAGTPPYMSPEQIRGEVSDTRCDIFSFGILLYEMLSGKLPFDGENRVELLHAILHDESQPLSQIRPDVDIELDRIVNRALKKDPQDRYQTITELRTEVIRLIQEKGYAIPGIPRPSGLSGIIRAELTPSRLARLLFPTLVIAVVAVAGIGWLLFRTRHQTELAPVFSSRPLLIDSWKLEPGEGPSEGRFSSDARAIVFASTKGGDSDIWVRQLISADSMPITRDKWKESSPIWSPDRERISFVSDRGNQPGIWAIPAFGGTPALLTSLEEASAVLRRWSKDGRQIYYEYKWNLYALDVDARTTTQLTHFVPSGPYPQGFNVSPDEERIAYADLKEGQADIWVMPIQGGTPTRITSDPAEDRNPVWHPDLERIIYSSNRAGVYQICVAHIKGSEPVQVTHGDSDSFVSDVSSDGSRVLYYTSKEESDVWGLRISTREEFQVTSDIGVELWPDVSPDCKTVAFQATKWSSIYQNLFHCLILAMPTGTPSQQTHLTSDAFDPKWSPDGGKLGVLRRSGDLANLWVVGARGGDERQLTTGGISFSGYSFVPPYNRAQTRDWSWSFDGTRIAYCSSKSGHSNVWIVSADGSNESNTSGNTDANLILNCPLWSPDGSRIAYVSTAGSRTGEGKLEWTVWVWQRGKSEPIFKNDSVLRLLGWSQSGDELIIRSVEGSSKDVNIPTEVRLFRVSAPGDKSRSITRLQSAYFSNIQLSPDRRSIAFAAHQHGRDSIWIVPVAGRKPSKVSGDTDPRTYLSSLAWSPDGRAIYYGKQGSWNLISMIRDFK